MIQNIIQKTILITIIIAGLLGTSLSKTYAQSGDPVIAGAGDISPRSNNGAQMKTSDLINAINPAVVLTFGDNQYPDGILSDFNTYYNPSWGRFKSKTRPSLGNHDYHTAGAAGYFDYFNGVGINTGLAGERGKGYYSFNVGSWHLIALNSEVMSSTQNTWLQADLAANQNTACVLAYWHHPRFSSGATHGSSTRSAPFWDLLYQSKADVVLAGHDHLYERFAPQTPTGAADATRGIRQFTVGTGGAGLYPFGSPLANSQARFSTHGVLKMTLHPGSYDWQFINLNSQVLDSGSGTCVGGGTSATSTPVPSSPPPTGGVTNTPPPGSTSVGVALFLHGIGKAGDNVSATAAGNMNPQHPSRNISVVLKDTNNTTYPAFSGTVQFDTASGDFKGSINLNNTINTGGYLARVLTDGYLSKQHMSILTITKGQVTQLPSFSLTTGDVNKDNLLNVNDYNMILDCFADLSPARNCADPTKKQITDLTDDGNVNQFDYNLFLRELSVQPGQ